MPFGVDDALMIGLAGSSLMSGKGGGDGQELSPFEGDLDPNQIAGQLKGGLTDYLKAAIAKANEPVRLNTTVAPLPNFTGGGLPMDISAPAMDPNRRDPSRRTFSTGAELNLDNFFDYQVPPPGGGSGLRPDGTGPPVDLQGGHPGHPQGPGEPDELPGGHPGHPDQGIPGGGRPRLPQGPGEPDESGPYSPGYAPDDPGWNPDETSQAFDMDSGSPEGDAGNYGAFDDGSDMGFDQAQGAIELLMNQLQSGARA